MGILKNTITEVQILLQANATYVVSGNSASSNIAFSTQNVAGASIKKVFATVNSASGSWTIKRGANVVWQASGNFAWDFMGNGMPITQDPAANLVFELSGGSGSLLVSIGKDSNI